MTADKVQESELVIRRTITPAVGAEHILETRSRWPDLGVEAPQYQRGISAGTAEGILRFLCNIIELTVEGIFVSPPLILVWFYP